MRNCTPHTINIIAAHGDQESFTPCGTPCRVTEIREPCWLPGVDVPCVRVKFGDIQGLPGDGIAIVSGIVGSAVESAAIQGDSFPCTVISPDTGSTAVRNGDGRIVAVRGFRVHYVVTA